MSERPAADGLARAVRLGHHIQRVTVGSRVAGPAIQRALSPNAQPVGDALADDGVAEAVIETFAGLLLHGWAAARVADLIRDFGLQDGGLNSDQWVAVASAHNALVDRPADVRAFARMAGWDPAGKADLAAAWAPAQGGLSGAECAAVATAHAALANEAARVCAFVTLEGWAAANKATLAALFGADAGGRTALHWAAIAEAHAALADQEARVALFARVANGWTAANLAIYAGLFGADAGGRPALPWTELAAAHADVADQEAVLASLARAGWLAADLTGFFTQALAVGAGAPALLALLAIAGAAASTRAMIVATWTPGNLGTFVGTALQAGLPDADLAAFLGTANVPASTIAMWASWGAAPLAQFTVGALVAGAAPAGLELLMAEGGFPASSFALVAGTWTAAAVGQFCAGALAVPTPPATVQGLISSVNAPAALRNMTVAGWDLGSLGTFAGTVRAGGVADAALLQLMQNAAFRTGTVLMRIAAWPAGGLGEFVVGIQGAGLAVADIGTLTNTANFGANSLLWVAAGFSAAEVGRLCGAARQVNGGAFTPAALTAFLAAANAAAGAFALLGPWAVAEIGATVAHCRTRAGAPSDDEMVQLLDRAALPAGAAGPQVQLAWVRTAATGAGCGAPAWGQVIAHLPVFQANWLGPRLNAGQVPRTFAGTRGGGGYQIQIRLPGGRIDHVEERHTFEYHLFTFANCTRIGVAFGGFSSFTPVGTNVTATLVAIQGDAAADNIAENAAENAAFGTAFPTQGNTLGYRFGILSAGGPYGPAGNQIYPTYMSQCYPTAGTNIVGRDLVAIGRFFGQIL